MATGIRLTPRRRFGQFLITKPAGVEIGGAEVGQAPWRAATSFQTSPGTQEVTVYFAYMGKKRTGAASLAVEVRDGEEADLVYRSPWIVTNKGSLKRS